MGKRYPLGDLEVTDCVTLHYPSCNRNLLYSRSFWIRKVSLLRPIGLLDTPSEGQITLQGQQTAGLPEHNQNNGAHIGFIFQSFNPSPFFRLENVELALSWPTGLASRTKRAGRTGSGSVGLEIFLLAAPDN